MLIKYLQKFDVEKFGNELIVNLDYVTEEEITQLEHKAHQIKGICKAAIRYRRKSQDVNRKRKQIKEVEIATVAAIASADNNKSTINRTAP